MFIKLGFNGTIVYKALFKQIYGKDPSELSPHEKIVRQKHKKSRFEHIEIMIQSKIYTLIQRLIEKDPIKRISVEETLVDYKVILDMILLFMKMVKVPEIALFFDNDSDNFDKMKLYPNIVGRKVGGMVNIQPATDEDVVAYYSKLESSSIIYGRLLPMIYVDDDGNRHNDYIDLQSGLSNKDIDMLKKLNENDNNYYVGTVVFDFDRTLTTVEGVPPMPDLDSFVTFLGEYKEIFLTQTDRIGGFTKDEIESIDIDSIIHYQFGGKERLDNLKEMWNSLLEKKIGIIVLTNNSNTSFIYDILQKAELPVLQKNIIKNSGIKYDTMMSNEELRYYHIEGSVHKSNTEFRKSRDTLVKQESKPEKKDFFF